MDEVPLCVPFSADKLVGRISLDPDYNERLTQFLMDGVKFNLASMIRHDGSKPKLSFLSFVPRPAVPGNCADLMEVGIDAEKGRGEIVFFRCKNCGMTYSVEDGERITSSMLYDLVHDPERR